MTAVGSSPATGGGAQRAESERTVKSVRAYCAAWAAAFEANILSRGA